MPRPLLTATIAGALALFAATPLISQAARTPGQVQRELDRTQAALDERNRRAQALTSDIRRLSARARELGDGIDTLTVRRDRITQELATVQKRLAALQASLREERATAARSKVRLAAARELLSARLLELYKAGEPDLMSLALESQDFSQLFERAELLRRISDRDQRIIANTAAARDEAQTAADRLTRLSAEAQEVAVAIDERRQAVSETHAELSAQRANYRSARADRRAALSQVDSQREHLEHRHDELEAESRRVRAALLQAPPPASGASGDGPLGWPTDGPMTSTFGQRWGRLHAGIDIAPPEGTAIRAAAGGTVVIAGWQGGYGNMTCVQHSASLTTCYAHQNTLQVSVGKQVAAGEVIGAVGNTGNSTGPHLHFETRVNGSPVDPMNYL